MDSRVTNPERQIASYFAQYDPPVAKLGKALRAKLRARLSGLFEIVYFYENQHSLVFSYSPTEHGYQGVCSLALQPDGAKLHFGQGAQLSKADPGKLLQGTGKTVRHVPLSTIAEYGRPEIEALMTAALKLASVRPVPGAKGAVILKAEEQKQRARASKKPARKVAARVKAKPR